MAENLVILVCDTEAKANEAVGFLAGSGVPTANITKESVTQLVYDAQTYDGGAHDSLGGKWVVIGRK